MYDCIVLGFGGVGSAALRAAASRGWNVIGIDQFGPAHNRGSSQGQTRIIRHAYFEHPNYVPLTHRAFEQWDELNRRHRTSIDIKEIITPCGLLQVGRPESDVIQGVIASADQHGLRVERFTPEEIQRRLPMFKIPEDYIGLFEPDAGFLRVELAVAAALKQASKQGATLKSNTIVHGWSVDANGDVLVETDQGSIQGRRLIIAAGAWSSPLLPSVDVPFKILQKQQHWFQLDRVDQKIENDFPAFLIEEDNGDCFYGLPEIDYLGMKVCEHSGGKTLESPDQIQSGLNQEELDRTESFMNRWLEFGRARLVHHCQCMYTMSPDGHFVVDRYPGFENVVFAAGLSGHGFKFVPVIGNYLCELLDGKQDELMSFLKLNR
ncbi:MAG: N-methyl-L-tryptophan oxidase [Planctomycetota bacterium]